MTVEERASQITKELTTLRKGYGLTPAQLVKNQSMLLHLRVVDEMVEGQDSGSNRALAACGLIHHFLHLHHSDSRNFRALAWALNLNVDHPWAGEVVALFSDRQLMARRDALATHEEISPTGGGKPMSEWEKPAIEALSQELAAGGDPPIALDGSAFVRLESVTTPSVDPTPATPEETAATNSEAALTQTTSTAAAVVHEPRNLRPPENVRGNRLKVAAAVAVLVAAAVFVSSRIGSSDDGDLPVETAAETPTLTVTSIETPSAAPTVEPTPEQALVLAEEPEPAAETQGPALTATPVPTATLEPAPSPIPEPTATAESQPTPTPSPQRLDKDRFVDEDGDHPLSETKFTDVTVAGQLFEDSVYLDVWGISPPDRFVSEFEITGGPFTRFQAVAGMGSRSDSQAVVRLVITDERLEPPLYERDFRLGEHDTLDLPIAGVVRLRFEVTVVSGRKGEYSGIGLGDPRLS